MFLLVHVGFLRVSQTCVSNWFTDFCGKVPQGSPMTRLATAARDSTQDARDWQENDRNGKKWIEMDRKMGKTLVGNYTCKIHQFYSIFTS